MLENHFCHHLHWRSTSDSPHSKWRSTLHRQHWALQIILGSNKFQRWILLRVRTIIILMGCCTTHTGWDIYPPLRTIGSWLWTTKLYIIPVITVFPLFAKSFRGIRRFGKIVSHMYILKEVRLEVRNFEWFLMITAFLIRSDIIQWCKVWRDIWSSGLIKHGSSYALKPILVDYCVLCFPNLVPNRLKND